MADPAKRPSGQGVAVLTIAWLCLAVVALTLAFSVAEGEARSHATSHVFRGFAAIALYLAVGLLWRPIEGTRGSLGRAAVLVLLVMGAFGQVVEAIGATGYDRFDAATEIGALTTLHNTVGILGPIALLAIPVGVIGLLVTVVVRVRERKTPT